MVKSYEYFNLKNLTYQHFIATIVVVAIAGFGSYFFINSFAASPYVSITAASGTLTPPATVQSSASATGDQYVQFGSATSSTCGSSMSAPSGYSSSQLIFDDPFCGATLNTNNWNPYLGPGTPWADKGALPTPYTAENMPGADDVALYNPSQITVNNGLTLTATPYSGTYTSLGYTWLSGVITSKNPLPAGGWYVQVNAEMPDTSHGIWPAIWALPANSDQELDGYGGGFTGPNPDNEQGNSDTFASSGQIDQLWDTPGNVNVSTSYNSYGFQYIPGSGMNFYFNGTKVYSSSTDLSEQGYYLFIQMQVAGTSTTGWHSVVSSSTPTTTWKIAEVQAYN